MGNGHFVPIFEHGNKAETANYRSITINDSLSQLFIVCIQKQVEELLEKENILPPPQAGFRKSHRLTNYIFTLISLINKSVKKGIYPYTCFVDFSKAYGSINRDLLFKKRSKTDVSGKIT